MAFISAYAHSDREFTRSPRADKPIERTAVFLIAAVGATAFSVPLHALSPIFAIGLQIVIGATIVARAPGYAPAFAIFLSLFQNLFVSAFSPLIGDSAELNFVRGYNFLATVAMWLSVFIPYLFQAGYPAQVRRMMTFSTLVLVVVTLYFIYGFAQSGMDAAVYLRNIALPIFLFQLSLLTSVTTTVRLTPVLIAMALLMLGCGYFELLFREGWLQLTNGDTYWGFNFKDILASGSLERQMHQTGLVFLNYRDLFRTQLFNTPLLGDSGEVMRLVGPNMSVIPFGYALSFFCLFLLAVGLWPVALLMLPLLLFVSAKGPIILIVFVVTALISTRLFGAVRTLVVIACALVVYGILGIQTGVQAGDYHAIGFMGGLNGFLSNPLGRGLGIGGNLSAGYFDIDWSKAQAAGAVEGAVESAVGVLLYQMGVAACVPLALYLWIGFSAWKLYARTGIAAQGVAAFGMFVIVFNGLFQEEALFSPPALGLIISLAGLVIGNDLRTNRQRYFGAQATASANNFAD